MGVLKSPSDLEYWKAAWVGNAKPPWRGERSDEDFRVFLETIPPNKDGNRALVPLCGDSEVLVWLQQAGWDVTGVEFVREAVLRFFETFYPGEKIHKRQVAEGSCFTLGTTRIFQQDFFNFSDGDFDLVYDRAALIAIPPCERVRYAEKLSRTLASGGVLYVETMNSDEGEVCNAPFPISSDEVLKLFSGMRLQEQSTREVFQAVSNMYARGATQVWKTRTILSRV